MADIRLTLNICTVLGLWTLITLLLPCRFFYFLFRIEMFCKGCQKVHRWWRLSKLIFLVTKVTTDNYNLVIVININIF